MQHTSSLQHRCPRCWHTMLVTQPTSPTITHAPAAEWQLSDLPFCQWHTHSARIVSTL